MHRRDSDVRDWTSKDDWHHLIVLESHLTMRPSWDFVQRDLEKFGATWCYSGDMTSDIAYMTWWSTSGTNKHCANFLPSPYTYEKVVQSMNCLNHVGYCNWSQDEKYHCSRGYPGLGNMMGVSNMFNLDCKLWTPKVRNPSMEGLGACPTRIGWAKWHILCPFWYTLISITTIPLMLKYVTTYVLIFGMNLLKFKYNIKDCTLEDNNGI